MHHSLNAHLGRVDDNADVYRAVLQGGMSSHPEVRQIVAESRDDVVCRRRARTHEPDTSRTHRSPSPAAGHGRLIGHG